MTAPDYDEDDAIRQIEETAQRWSESEQHRNAVLAASAAAVPQMREYMAAIALARFEHIDARPLENAATDFLTGLGPEVWWRMVWDLAWDGGPSAVETARRQAQAFQRLQVREKPKEYRP